MKNERLLDQWAFSTETAFRIPQFMNELCESIVWERWERKQKEHGLTIPPPAFTRRVLTSQEDDDKDKFLKLAEPASGELPYHILYDFTFSDRLQKLIRSHRENGLVDLGPFESQKAIDAITHLAAVIGNLNEKWPAILDVLVANHKLEHAIAERLKTFSSERYFHITCTLHERFRWLSELYSLYSRLSHYGFNTQELTKIHFQNESEYAAGCPSVLAYLLRAKKTDSGILIEGILEVGMNGDIKDVNIAPKEEWPIKPKNGTFVLGFDDKDNDLPNLFLAVYNVFNDYVERRFFHQIFIPVYERSLFSLSPNSDKRFCLSVAGAFLGWLSCDLGDDPPNGVFYEETPEKEPDKNLWISAYAFKREASEQFYGFAVGLRFILNHQFSGPYLQGEMAWALEQPTSNPKTLAEFVENNIHHFGGWFGDSHYVEPPPEFPGLFCFRSSKSQSFIKTGDQNISTEEVDELWLDLTSIPSWEKAPEETPLIIKLCKRLDTALPRNNKDMQDYGRYIAGRYMANSIRNFADRAKLLAIKQELGRSILAEEFAHQIKQAAHGFSEGWFTTHEGKRLLERTPFEVLPNGETVEEFVNKAKIASIPSLFEDVGKILLLWSASSVAELDSNVTPASSINKLMDVSLTLSAANQVFIGAQNISLDEKADIIRTLNIRKKARGRTDLFQSSSNANRIYFRKDKYQKSMTLDFVRLFEALFTNWRRHSPDNSSLNCKITINDHSIVFVLENQSKGAKATEGHGIKIIRKLVERLNGLYEPTKDTPFIQTITFAINNFDIKTEEESQI